MSCLVTAGIHGSVSNSPRMKTLLSRTSCIFNSPELSDVKFIFKNAPGSVTTNGHGQGQGGETIIHGHKLILILALASSVFPRMFYMDKESKHFVTAVNDKIRMVDYGLNARAFLEFLRFLHTDRICYKDLEFQLIVGILDCADHYDVPCLKVDCRDQLVEMLSKENVFQIMRIGKLFEGWNLAAKALEFIDQNLGSLVESEEIFCIKLETLFEILKRDSLDIDECFVLDLAMKWAGKECQRNDREPTSENKRDILGKAFFEIRFGLLTSDRISELVSSNLLSARESLDAVLDVYSPGYVTTAGTAKRLRLAPEVGFKSNARIFGQKVIWMEIQEMEKKWKEENNFDHLKAMSLAKGQADLYMRGFPRYMSEEELSAEIQEAKGSNVFDLEVNELENVGEFRVQFKYNSTEYRLTDLLDPAWYEFDSPSSIRIMEWYDDDDY